MNTRCSVRCWSMKSKQSWFLGHFCSWGNHWYLIGRFCLSVSLSLLSLFLSLSLRDISLSSMYHDIYILSPLPFKSFVHNVHSMIFNYSNSLQSIKDLKTIVICVKSTVRIPVFWGPIEWIRFLVSHYRVTWYRVRVNRQAAQLWSKLAEERRRHKQQFNSSPG